MADQLTPLIQLTQATDRCASEKNKKIFASHADAETFEKRNRESFGNQQQYAYRCPHADHLHLASSPSYVAGAPQVRTTDWSRAANWQVVDPEQSVSRNDTILTALRRYNGNKTVKEIGLECGLPENQLTQVYNLAREHNLPYKPVRESGRMASLTPAVTLQSVQSRRLQMEAELRQLDELEKDIIRKEEEKKRVIVKLASNGNKSNETMIWATTYGGGNLWLTTEQANSLLAQLPAVIEEMKAREVK